MRAHLQMRVDRQHEKQRHRHVERAHPPPLGEETLHERAEAGPQGDAWQIDRHEHRRDHEHAGSEIVLRDESSDAAERHGPRLWIDPLKRGGFQERHRPR